VLNKLTYSIEQIPSLEANRFSVSQEIPRILWNPNVHYCIHKCLPPFSIKLTVVTNENYFWIMLFCAMTICRNVSEKHDRDSGFLRQAGNNYIAY